MHRATTEWCSDGTREQTVARPWKDRGKCRPSELFHGASRPRQLRCTHTCTLTAQAIKAQYLNTCIHTHDFSWGVVKSATSSWLRGGSEWLMMLHTLGREQRGSEGNGEDGEDRNQGWGGGGRNQGGAWAGDGGECEGGICGGGACKGRSRECRICEGGSRRARGGKANKGKYWCRFTRFSSCDRGLRLSWLYDSKVKNRVEVQKHKHKDSFPKKIARECRHTLPTMCYLNQVQQDCKAVTLLAVCQNAFTAIPFPTNSMQAFASAKDAYLLVC